MKSYYCIILILVATACNNTSSGSKIDYITDSLKSVIDENISEIKWIKKRNPGVIIENKEATTCAINLFHPFGLGIEIVNDRPENNNNTFLCVSGAYSSNENTIDGIFIKKGVLVNKAINEKLNGLCIFTNDNLHIENSNIISDSLINEAIISKSSMFQQTLLIKNSNIIECKLFGDHINLRRALIKFDDSEFLVGESHRPMTIFEFQKALKEIGVLDAVNLDMGSWSEGWYKSNNGKISIGDNFANTKRQTNWIVYKLN